MFVRSRARIGRSTWQSWNKTDRGTRPCGYLTSGNECPHQDCPWSHDPKEISRAKDLKNNTNRKCVNGPGCTAHEKGCCCYYHPPPHQNRRQREARIENMIRGLRLVEELTLDDRLLSVDGKRAYIQDLKKLASFNKLIGGEVAVPGCPPVLNLLNGPMLLQFDCDNKDIQPAYPTYRYSLEPLLRSVEKMSPGFDMFQSSDIIVSSGTLRKLFLFLRVDKYALPKINRYEIEWRNNTLLLSKWADDPEYTFSAGRGAGFERKTCRYGDDVPDVVRQSTSHHRVVRYTLGGLRLVVQSEVDAWLPVAEPASRSTTQKKQPTRPAPLGARTRRDSGVALTSPSTRGFGLLAMDDPGDSPEFSEWPGAKAIDATSSSLPVYWPCGTDVHPSRLIEVKTNDAANCTRFFPETQLYFSRTGLLYHATHEGGLFTPANASVRDVRAEVDRWEMENGQELGRLAEFLGMLKNIVGEHAVRGCLSFSLVCDGSDKQPVARLFARDDGVHLLPLDVE